MSTTTAHEKDTSDPDWSKAYRNTKDVPWYLDSIDRKVTPEVSQSVSPSLSTLLSVKPVVVSEDWNSLQLQ